MTGLEGATKEHEGTGAQNPSAPCWSCGLHGVWADPGAQWLLCVPVATFRKSRL